MTSEELNLLAKLASGVLDGMVGDEREYRGYMMSTIGLLLGLN